MLPHQKTATKSPTLFSPALTGPAFFCPAFSDSSHFEATYSNGYLSFQMSPITQKFRQEHGIRGQSYSEHGAAALK